MNLTKKCSVGLILALVFLLLIMQSPPVVAAELTNQQKALGFLGDVVGLDLAKYDVELKWYNDYSSYANRLYDADLTCDLKSESSQMTAKFFFKNNAKFICDIRDLKGPMLLTQSTTDRLDAAKGFMDRYQAFTGSSYLEPLTQMLHNVTEPKNMTVTVNDLRLKVEPSPVGEDFVTFQWMYTPNGIHNRYTRITLMLKNGVLEQFSDNWNNCLVGSSEVNVSEEQAISIAKEHIAAYSYMFGNKSIGNLTVKTDLSPLATLSMQVRKDNLLYPRWELLVPLAEVYPGFVTGMRVYLWADTGELSLIEKSGGGGGAVPETSEDAAEISEESTPTPSQTAISQTPSMAVFTVAAFSATVACVALMVYWAKFRKTSMSQAADKHE
jgi:hypothetical protein